jgi:hypothetical protein
MTSGSEIEKNKKQKTKFEVGEKNSHHPHGRKKAIKETFWEEELSEIE